MISDVLSDAHAEISRYQREMPDVYDAISAELEDLKQRMERVRIWLDSMPFPMGPTN